ncbi:E3 ubiquitin-protein ligase [Schistosoma japonicum]|nr:E3 ubiquitin-protein ligase [Schistosoma japonicum]
MLDDFLLQHYDDGACKGKLGHSRASVIGHRVYVVSVFTGLTILLLVAAPFIMIAVPCIICAKCHRLYHQHRLRKRHSQGLYMVNGRLLTTSVSSNVQNDQTNTLQPTSPTPHHSVFISSCRSSFVSVDQQPTVEQKADIHWLPCHNESKCASSHKVMHRSSSVPVHYCTASDNVVMTSHTPYLLHDTIY